MTQTATPAPPQRAIKMDVETAVTCAEAGDLYRHGKKVGVILGFEQPHFSRKDRTHVIFVVQFPKAKTPDKFRHEVISTFTRVVSVPVQDAS